MTVKAIPDFYCMVLWDGGTHESSALMDNLQLAPPEPPKPRAVVIPSSTVGRVWVKHACPCCEKWGDYLDDLPNEVARPATLLHTWANINISCRCPSVEHYDALVAEHHDHEARVREAAERTEKAEAEVASLRRAIGHMCSRAPLCDAGVEHHDPH